MTDWQPLRTALSRMRSAGIELPLWWRDDDATAPTQALDRLEALSEHLKLPVHLAAVPSAATDALAQRVENSEFFYVLVHGWAHVNHAPEHEKKSEFGQIRQEARAEFSKALGRLRRLFGASLQPVFVPPWNRMHPDYVQQLADAGYKGLSMFQPRTRSHPAPGFLQINAHVDPVDWRGTRGLVDPDRIIAHTVARLEARLVASEDRSEPMGYLTHHLVHTEDVWEFSHAFLTEMLSGGATIQTIRPLMEIET